MPHLPHPSCSSFKATFLAFWIYFFRLPAMTSHREDQDEDGQYGWNELPDPLELPTSTLLGDYQDVNILAPLVRCSKLPFRHLVSLYETHITHTPMILAQEFSRSQMARVSDFSTSSTERGVFWVEPKRPGGARQPPLSRDSGPEHAGPSSSVKDALHGKEGYVGGEERRRDDSGLPLRLPPSFKPPTKHSQLVRGRLVAQFASPNAASLADAAELVSPYVDSIDLNCGCPQKWAYHEGIGCALLRKPELVRDMVRSVKDRMGWDFGISVKIRVDPDLKCVSISRKQESTADAIQTDGETGPVGGRGRCIARHSAWSYATSGIDRAGQSRGPALRCRVREGRGTVCW